MTDVSPADLRWTLRHKRQGCYGYLRPGRDGDLYCDKCGEEIVYTGELDVRTP